MCQGKIDPKRLNSQEHKSGQGKMIDGVTEGEKKAKDKDCP